MKIKYTENEKYIISLYKGLIAELREEIDDLKMIVEHNKSLDAKKITSVTRSKRKGYLTIDIK